MEVILQGMKDDVRKALNMAGKASKSAVIASDNFSAANKEIEAMKRTQTLENKAVK